MKRTTILAVAAMFVCGIAVAQPPDCPWRFITGHWESTDSQGNRGEVVWKLSEGNALIGIWEDKDGKSTELVGWRSEKKEFVTTGYGDKGEYWEGIFPTVTKSMIKGKIFHRLADGKIRKGTLQLTKKNDDLVETEFVGTIGGEKVTVMGTFKRLKKAKK